MTRRIVQIATSTIPQFESAHASCFAVYALCDDGSLWTQAMAEKEWFRLPDIPQGEPADPDPIAELEAMNARMAITMGSLWWIVANERNIDTGREQIEWPFTQANARAAAARLLARVRGAK